MGERLQAHGGIARSDRRLAYACDFTKDVIHSHHVCLFFTENEVDMRKPRDVSIRESFAAYRRAPRAHTNNLTRSRRDRWLDNVAVESGPLPPVHTYVNAAATEALLHGLTRSRCMSS